MVGCHQTLRRCGCSGRRLVRVRLTAAPPSRCGRVVDRQWLGLARPTPVATLTRPASSKVEPNETLTNTSPHRPRIAPESRPVRRDVPETTERPPDPILCNGSSVAGWSPPPTGHPSPPLREVCKLAATASGLTPEPARVRGRVVLNGPSAAGGSRPPTGRARVVLEMRRTTDAPRGELRMPTRAGSEIVGAWATRATLPGRSSHSQPPAGSARNAAPLTNGWRRAPRPSTASPSRPAPSYAASTI